MRNIICLILIAATTSIIAQSADEAASIQYVWASAIHLRAAPSQDSASIALIPWGTRVTVKEDMEQTRADTIKVALTYKTDVFVSHDVGYREVLREEPIELYGNWTPIQYQGNIGWVHGAYLSTIQPPLPMEGQNFDEQREYVRSWVCDTFGPCDTTYHGTPGNYEEDYKRYSCNGIVLEFGFQGKAGVTIVKIPGISQREGWLIAYQIFRHFSLSDYCGVGVVSEGKLIIIQFICSC